MRGLISHAIRQRWMVVLMATIAMFYGVGALMRIPLDVFPEFVPPQVAVQTEAPGWTAEQVEQRITAPIEAALAGTLGVAILRSDSIDGLSVVNLGFDDHADPYRVRQGVAERLAEVATTLPDGVPTPKISPLTSSTMDVLKFGLQSKTLDRFALRDIATWEVRPRLLAIPGVARVTVFGGGLRQWQIRVDPARLEASGLSLRTVVEAARAALQVRGGGTLELDAQRLPVVLMDAQATETSLLNLVLGADRNGPLYLRDVADVVADEAPPIGDALIQGAPGVLLTLSGQYGSNTLAITHDIEAAIDALRPSLAERGVDVVTPLHRPANFIERALSELADALALGSLLILGTLFVFLRHWRTVAISFVTIPLSLLVTVAVLHQFGLTINTLTLGGFAVAIGLLVDDAIVDIENVVRRLESNAKNAPQRPTLAVILDASLEIRSPVFYATLVVLLAFIPVLALSGVQGRLLTPMAMAFVVSVAVSLLVALTVTPALCAILLRTSSTETEPSWWRSVVAYHQRGMRWIDGRFRIVMVALVLVLAATTVLLPGLRGEFFPMFREGHFVLQVFARQPGTSIAEMRRMGASISREVLQLPYIATIEQQIGRAELGEDTWGTHRSEFHVELKPDADVDQMAVQRALRRVLARYPGVQSEVMTFLGDRISETMTGETSAVVISVVGKDLDTLDRLAQQVVRVARTVPGVVDLKLGTSSSMAAIGISVDPGKAERAGVNMAAIGDTVTAAYAGIPVGQVRDQDQAVDVAVTFPPAWRARPEAIGELPIGDYDGHTLRVADVASVQDVPARPVIQHDAGRRRSIVAFNVNGRAVSAVVDELKQRLGARVTLPPGTHIEFGGVADAEQRAHRELLMYSLLAVALIALSLGLAFRRAADVAMVLLNMPFALIGSVAAIAISGIGLSIGSLVGLVTVFGISARNAILMLAHYDHLRSVEQHAWAPELAWRGASERLRPVLMTALVTALGLIPLATGLGRPGHEIEAPMAITVLGGLLTSTILTLGVLPAVARRLVFSAASTAG